MLHLVGDGERLQVPGENFIHAEAAREEQAPDEHIGGGGEDPSRLSHPQQVPVCDQPDEQERECDPDRD